MKVLIFGGQRVAKHTGVLGKDLQDVESDRWYDLGEILVDLIGWGQRLGRIAVGGNIVDLLHLDVELWDIESDCQSYCAACVDFIHKGDKGYRRTERKLNADVQVTCGGRKRKWRKGRIVATMVRMFWTLGDMKKLTIRQRESG